jgi:hypothetical protein
MLSLRGLKLGSFERPNPPASVDGGIPFLFHAERSGPAATEQVRWAWKGSVRENVISRASLFTLVGIG